MTRDNTAVHPVTAEERVALYEVLFDEVSAALREERPLSDELRRKTALLEKYYTSGEWREDYEADEAGLFPADLKRGVLSQDGLYDLLSQCPAAECSGHAVHRAEKNFYAGREKSEGIDREGSA